MTAIGASPQGWRSWLLSNTPQSRLQAKLGALYHAWLSFLANPLALAGMVIVIALLLMALLAPVLAPASPYAQDLTQRLLPPSHQRRLPCEGRAVRHGGGALASAPADAGASDGSGRGATQSASQASAR